jgi:catechol-2,3-dioxygenase
VTRFDLQGMVDGSRLGATEPRSHLMPIPPRVSAVALRTADLARATAFYVGLGWELSPASTGAMSLFKTEVSPEVVDRPAG